MNVIVIGGGAAGLMAACRLAGNGVQVRVAERFERVGRKLLATGNGRCNLSNRNAAPDRYFGAPELLSSILGCWPPERIRQVFDEFGIPFSYDEEGRAYPACRQASAVLDVLRMVLKERGGIELPGTGIAAIMPESGGFRLKDETGRSFSCDRVLATVGGAAAPKLGGSEQGYGLLTALGHSLIPLRPVLVPLRTGPGPVRGLKGLRVRGDVRLTDGDMILARESGEVLFTEEGVSGICVMQLSRFLPGKGAPFLHIDLMPSMTREALYQRAYRLGERPVEELFTGCIPRPVGRNVLLYADLQPGGTCGELTSADLKKIDRSLHDYRIRVTGTTGMENAQVTRGGIPGTEFDPHTLESRIVPGLYAAGEVLDVDGDCGGYNLHWAWASALTAADAISGRSAD